MTDGQHELIWRKGRSCANSACIEVARDGAYFLVRDSAGSDGVRLSFGVSDWTSFVAALQHDDRAMTEVDREGA